MRGAKLWGTAAVALTAAMLSSTGAQATDAKRETPERLSDGTVVDVVSLTNAHGVSARIISLGATLQKLLMPDRHGKLADVELGYDDAQSYADHPNFWGASVGRYANRIAGGRFSLDGKPYQLPLNDKVNSLHGGTQGFDKRNWTLVGVKSGAQASATFVLISPAGDQGYPGTLTAKVTYTLDETGDLEIEFSATTDAPTIVNLTNHAIFNLAGEGAADGIYHHKLTVPASRYTPVNSALIPTGQLKPVAGTAFDFTRGKTLAEGIRDGRDPQIVAGRGFDHNFALDAGLTKDPKLAARLEDADSGRVLEVWTDQPGVQVYTGNFLDSTLIGKSGHLYRMGDGIALEPQKFPDTPNQPAFGSARIDPMHPYHHRIIFRLSTTG